LKDASGAFPLLSDHEIQRYIFHTQGICPPEIHFRIHEGILREVRFVGGGCPGHAHLVSRLLQERPLNEVLELLKEINCRNGTSCPDQLAKAIIAAKDGTLDPARSFQVYTDPQPRNRLGLIGDLGGRSDNLKMLFQEMREREVDIIYCLGNLTGNSLNNRDLIELGRKEGILAIQGELDWRYAQGDEGDRFPPLEQKYRDRLIRLPHVLSFQIGEKTGMAFFGEYLQHLPGFSDFEPFALEINMVCGLTHFMQDETVFSALEAMIPQFKAQIILFSQINNWGHWQIGGIDFINIGSALNDNELTWGLLESKGEGIRFRIMKM